MQIVKLSIKNMEAWFDFFDNRGFQDHHAWAGCYCTYFYYPRFPESHVGNNSKREYARWLIENGKMNGYLVYEDEKVVGWCNADSKENYTRIYEEEDKGKKIKSIVCFLIQKDYRGRRIARKILKEIVNDSMQDGTTHLEAYPNFRPANEYSNYHGSVKMYLEEGFEIIKNGRKKKMVLTIGKDRTAIVSTPGSEGQASL
jgi:GNAT superfamily N-acetyltransferase